MAEANYPLDHLQPVSFAGEELAITQRRGLAFCQVLAARGRGEEVAAALGIDTLPGRAVNGAGFTAFPLAPRQWLLAAEDGRNGTFSRQIAARLKGLGHASEQSHGRAVIRLWGPAAPRVLAGECRLDLDPDQAPPGWVAQTSLADVGVLIHCLDSRPAYDLILYPGYAEHLWQWLCRAAGLPQQPHTR